MARSRDALILVSAVVAAVVSSGLFVGLLGPSGVGGTWSLPSGGRVKTVGVGIYWDVGCEDAVSFLDWGVVEPGSSVNVSVYIRNEGNADMVLYLNVSNWRPPEAGEYMTVDWDYDGRAISPGEVVEVVMILTVSEDVGDISSYNFDIKIIGVS